MSKRCRDPDSDGTTSASGFKTVFVATSLDTHLAISLSLSDTVADFKKKLILQHEQCFPKAGSLTVHSLKVKYHGKLYHLPESDMVISNAFEGYEGRWSVYVDTSSSLEVVKEQSPLDPCDKGKLQPAIEWKSPGESSRNGLEVGHDDGTFQENFPFIVNHMSVENDHRSKDNSKDQNEKLPSRNSYEARSGGSLNAKKKQKVKHNLHVAGESTLNATTTSPQAVGFEDSIVGAGPKVSTDVQLGGKDAGASPHNTMFSGTKTSEQAEPESHVFEKEAVYEHHSVELNIRSLDSDMENKSLEKSVAELGENMTSQDVPSQQVQEEQHVISASTKKKRKRKKQNQETNSPKTEVNAPKAGGDVAVSQQGSVLKEACDGQLSFNHEVCLSENVKPLDLVESTPVQREIVVGLLMMDKSPEADNSEASKSKIRKSKRSAMRKQDELDVEHDLRAHVEDQSRIDENVLPQNDEKKKKTKKSTSKHDYRVMERTKDAIDPLALKDSSGDVMADKSIEGMEEPKMVSPTNSHKNGNTASDNGDVHLPLSEVEHIQSINEDVDLNLGKEPDINLSQDSATVQYQVNTEHAKEAECPADQPDGEQKNKGTTKKKRKRKQKRTGNSTGQEGLGIPEVNPENIEDENLASLVEKSSDVENADTLKVNGSDKKRSIDQSGVSELGLGENSDLKGPGKSEQLVQTSDVTEVPAHGLASEGENGSVNFRRYFVPGDDHKEAASPDKVEGESNVVEGAEKADEKTIVPEGKRRPSKSWGNQKNSSGINTDDKSHERSSSKEKQNKSASEMETSTSSRKRSKSLNSTRDANVKALKKSVHPAITVTRKLEENNVSLTSSNLKSVSRDSNKILLNKSNQKKQTGINLKNTAAGEISRKKVKDLDKSSQEKSLLSSRGKIFGDGLSESSGDENGNMKSGSSTQSPSGSSSSSSSSEDLMSPGSINKDHKGGKTALGSKLADTRNMTIDMILRNSSRFKSAKLTASQSEADSEQVEFVPESQPIQ